MQTEIKIPFTAPQGKEKFNTLVLSVYHIKAGYGGMDWNYRPAATRLSFGPCSIHEGIRRSIMVSGDPWESGFYVTLNNAERANPHYNKRAAAAVENLALELRDAYEARDIEKLQALVATIAEKANKK
jgi:hypothetical protein